MYFEYIRYVTSLKIRECWGANWFNFSIVGLSIIEISDDAEAVSYEILPNLIAEIGQIFLVNRIKLELWSRIHKYSGIETTAPKHNAGLNMRILVQDFLCHPKRLETPSRFLNQDQRTKWSRIRLTNGGYVTGIQGKDNMITRLLSGIMHDLIIGTTKNLPVSRLRRMWRQQIACSVAGYFVNCGIDYTRFLELIRLEYCECAWRR